MPRVRKTSFGTMDFRKPDIAGHEQQGRTYRRVSAPGGRPPT
jgi:hypothetical protein